MYRVLRNEVRHQVKRALVATRNQIDNVLQTKSGKTMNDKLPDINHTLHDSRSARLRKLTQIDGTILSAGCAGIWYFDWISSRTGHVGRHIGIEYYNPKPDGLPSNVEWIANTAGDMNAVANETCDLVFSGQNLEHLWPEDVIGFFLESNRVLKQHALLVVDSPNRLITALLNWSHPEHTVEVTPSEVKKLAELSGFEVTALKGMWLCRDPKTGRMLPLEPRMIDPDYTYVERVLAAEDDPDNSMLWWLEAKKVSEPKREALTAEMNRIFDNAWPERTQRFLSLVGQRIKRDKQDAIGCDAGTSGVMIYGPYMPLKSGSYVATFELRVTTPGGKAHVARLDILGHGGRLIVARDVSQSDLEDCKGLVRLHFDLI
jgi:hypothetical protein